MTINELDQGIRNLIATQPEITNAHRDVINGINQLIDAYRNLSYRIQTYPGQDIMKFGLLNESAKFEITLTNLAYQVLQEHGINLLLYIPRINGFGMGQLGVGGTVDASSMMGQMQYMSGTYANPAHMPKVDVNTIPSQNQNVKPQQINEIPAQPIASFIPETAAENLSTEEPIQFQKTEQKVVPVEEEEEIKPRKAVVKPNSAESLNTKKETKESEIKSKSRDYLMNLLKN